MSDTGFLTHIFGKFVNFFLKLLWGRDYFCHIFSLFWQIVANSFLANPTTSALFATILVEYLLDRLPEMGSNLELSNLYLKLFKLVFGSVSLFAAENEQMLKVKLVQTQVTLCVRVSCFQCWTKIGMSLFIFVECSRINKIYATNKGQV